MSPNVTQLLNDIELGDPSATETLLPLVYCELQASLPPHEWPSSPPDKPYNKRPGPRRLRPLG